MPGSENMRGCCGKVSKIEMCGLVRSSKTENKQKNKTSCHLTRAFFTKKALFATFSISL